MSAHEPKLAGRVFALLAACALLTTLSNPTAVRGQVRLRLATTTSVENSGLTEHLIPLAERALGIRIEALPVGSGQALELAGRGDVDIVITHAPELEEQALGKGVVVEPRELMKNEFLLVGPPADPAQVRGSTNLAQALTAIARQKAPFVSRGDRSGTHAMEKQLWQQAGVLPAAPWYLEGGQGMGATLMMATERQAYTLADRATFLTYRGRTGLEILARNEPPLHNVYRVLLPNPGQHLEARAAVARKLAEWFVSPEAQRAIANFRPGGEPLFEPALPGPHGAKAEPTMLSPLR